MSDPAYTALLLIVDRSGSMAPIADAMSGAVSKLLKEQAALPGLTTVDLIQFNHQVARLHLLADPSAIDFALDPRGGTALFDAVGLSLSELSSNIASLPDHARPSRVQVVIITDGEDTASAEYTAEDVRALVRQREGQGWSFLFLGGDLDASAGAEQIGTARDNSVAFERSAASVRSALAQSSRMMARRRLATASNPSGVDRSS